MCAPVSPPVVVVFVSSMPGCSCDSVTTMTLAIVITVMAPGTHHQLPRDEVWVGFWRAGSAIGGSLLGHGPGPGHVQARATGCEPARRKVSLEPRSFGHIRLTLSARPSARGLRPTQEAAAGVRADKMGPGQGQGPAKGAVSGTGCDARRAARRDAPRRGRRAGRDGPRVRDLCVRTSRRRSDVARTTRCIVWCSRFRLSVTVLRVEVVGHCRSRGRKPRSSPWSSSLGASACSLNARVPAGSSALLSLPWSEQYPGTQFGKTAVGRCDAMTARDGCPIFEVSAPASVVTILRIAHDELGR